jgi:hypothetical protein
MPAGPLRVRWTEHALERATNLNIARVDVERIVIQQHHARRRNPRAADWRVTSGRLVIAYDHPDHGDAASAQIVTLWRRR